MEIFNGLIEVDIVPLLIMVISRLVQIGALIVIAIILYKIYKRIS